MSGLGIRDLSILLVEPSVPQRKIIRRQLEDAGISKLDEADSIASALDKVQQYMPDLVTSAMYLPDGTGTDLVKALRDNPDTRELPFMLVSSEQKWENLDPIRQAGVVAILPKPFDGTDLSNALASALDFLQPDELVLEHYEVEDLRVLLVDDSAMARNHLKRVLGDMGIENITLAKNGVEAVEILADNRFDLIVTDYNMPEMDGEELTSFIRTQSGQSDIPILMVTSEQDSARLSSVRTAGVSAVCDKPFEPASVKGLLKQILED